MIKDAEFSECKKHRYLLLRIWDDTLPLVGFIGLNPSTADAETDDHTIRRCMGFARDWLCGGIYMVNLFSFRATDPEVMKNYQFPIGLHNETYLLKAVEDCGTIVACWGNHGFHRNMGAEIVEFLKPNKLKCLGVTNRGMPKHPARIASNTQLINYP